MIATVGIVSARSDGGLVVLSVSATPGVRELPSGCGAHKHGDATQKLRTTSHVQIVSESTSVPDPADPVVNLWQDMRMLPIC